MLQLRTGNNLRELVGLRYITQVYSVSLNVRHYHCQL